MPDAERVLVADDDEDIIRFVEVNLRLDGFDVIAAGDGEQALSQAIAQLPDLVLLDVMMPGMDGIEVCRRLRSDGRTRHIPVIMLTARSLSADKVVALTAGADDYMIKPFDPMELVARVKSTTRRTREMRDVNPLTRLPGNLAVQNDVGRRVAGQHAFALMHIDLDNFKAFNDHYGFLRGDEAIKALAGCVQAAVQRSDGEDAFTGHVGGDDLVAVVGNPARAEAVGQAIVECWDRVAPGLYDAADAGNGYIEVPDRRNQMNSFPIMTVSIGVASNLRRVISSQWQAAEIAAEMKQFAKRNPRSSYAVDRRSGGGGR